MIHKFKPGDRVRCIEAVDDLIHGKIYRVIKYNNDGLVSITDTVKTQQWFERRFELVKPKGIETCQWF